MLGALPSCPVSPRAAARILCSATGSSSRTPGGMINAPNGPLAGEHASTITAVLLKHDGGYEIAAFHNTLITG